MTTPKLPGQIITLREARELGRDGGAHLGDAVKDAIARRGKASLALSGGNTPRPAYEALAAQDDIDWVKVWVYWIDERAVPPDHARSNYRLAREALLDRVPIPASQVYRMEGEATDLAQAASDYEAILARTLPAPNGVPVIDVAVMGIGDDGHTASLFPGETSVDVRDRQVLAIAAAPDKDREARLTLTAPVIQAIRTVLVLATGKAKHGPLSRVAAEVGTLHETPSRILRGVSGSLLWIVDEAAISGG